jgi:hypothetical protein
MAEAEILLTDAMERIHRVEGTDTLYGRRAMRWLGDLYVDQDEFASAEPLRINVLEACSRVLGPEANWTHLQGCQVANLFARQGKWKEAAQTYQAVLPYSQLLQRPEGTTNVHHTAALLTSWLGKDPQAVRDITKLCLERFGSTTNGIQNLELIKALLTLPQDVSSWDRIAAWTQTTLVNLEASPQRSLLSGLLAYRHADLIQAVRELTPLVEHRDAGVATLAGFFLSMAHQQSNSPTLAATSLQRAENRLEAVLRAGDLAVSTYPMREEWIPIHADRWSYADRWRR